LSYFQQALVHIMSPIKYQKLSRKMCTYIYAIFIVDISGLFCLYFDVYEMFPCLLTRGNIVAETKFASREAKMFPIKFRNIWCFPLMFPSVCPLWETWRNIGRKQCFLVCPGLYIVFSFWFAFVNCYKKFIKQGTPSVEKLTDNFSMDADYLAYKNCVFA
jgi:hypothetical protein